MGLAQCLGAFCHPGIVGGMVVGAGLLDAEHFVECGGEHVADALVRHDAADVSQQGAALTALLDIGLQGAQVGGGQGLVGADGVTAQGGQGGGAARVTDLDVCSADHGGGGAVLVNAAVGIGHPLAGAASQAAVDR
ncbi:hypothetical protein OY18_06990 [Xylella fastidiosa]|nr:hypothetical protein OY18_06990 [Xylella fastidiosa]